MLHDPFYAFYCTEKRTSRLEKKIMRSKIVTKRADIGKRTIFILLGQGSPLLLFRFVTWWSSLEPFGCCSLFRFAVFLFCVTQGTDRIIWVILKDLKGKKWRQLEEQGHLLTYIFGSLINLYFLVGRSRPSRRTWSSSARTTRRWATFTAAAASTRGAARRSTGAPSAAPRAARPVLAPPAPALPLGRWSDFFLSERKDNNTSPVICFHFLFFRFPPYLAFRLYVWDMIKCRMRNLPWMNGVLIELLFNLLPKAI